MIAEKLLAFSSLGDAREPIARAGPWKFCVWHPRMAMHADFRARSFMSCILVVSLPPDGAASAGRRISRFRPILVLIDGSLRNCILYCKLQDKRVRGQAFLAPVLSPFFGRFLLPAVVG